MPDETCDRAPWFSIPDHVRPADDDADRDHDARTRGGWGSECAPGPGDDCDTDGELALIRARLAAWLAHGPCWRPDLADCL